MIFQALKNFITENKTSVKVPTNIPHLNGISPLQWSFLLSQFIENDADWSQKSYILICEDNETAHACFDLLKSQELMPPLFFPEIGHSPYSAFIDSPDLCFERFTVLSKLCSTKKPYILITTTEALHSKLPPVNFFKNSLCLKTSDILPPHELAQKLVNLGYTGNSGLSEKGEFSQRGDIFDIYCTSGVAYRIHYFDDMIESILEIDSETFRTKNQESLHEISLYLSPFVLCHSNFVDLLREKIPLPSSQQKNKYEKRQDIFRRLSQGDFFENFTHFVPLFFKENGKLIDFLENETITFFLNQEKSIDIWKNFYSEMQIDFEREHLDNESDSLLPSPCEIFWEKINYQKNIFYFNSISSENSNLSYPCDFRTAKIYLTQQLLKTNTTLESYLEALFLFLKKSFESSGQIIFISQNENSKKEILYFLEGRHFPINLMNRISFLSLDLHEGFYSEQEKILVLTEAEIFGQNTKSKKNIKYKKTDLFAEQLSTLKIGDYVMHRDHGIGIYLGLESIQIAEVKTDYLIIQYEDKDKVYLPVYKIDLLQKHAEGNLDIKVANLKTNKFELAKEKARSSVKKLAFDLVKLQAERKASLAYAFSPPDHIFRDFELSFPFEETPDQARAIQDVLEDMQKPIPMDRLVCGDVGFGKTEVAMRAAFMAVLNKKQVAILVPTTILALQHYHSFVKRFKNFPVEIEFLSRLKTAKESKEILEKVSQGRVDIIIGTHKLISGDVHFKDLGIVIVDEEQRFGVAHKEQLKLLKKSVHFLTLTATPIPRTLQMAFLGLRDLSLIQTPPTNRQSIRTLVIRDEEHILKEAIQKELARGGQVFYVHNRVNDIELEEIKIKKLVPQARVLIAHGQLPEKELEKKMNEFYAKKCDVLLATTIIESGIDIPSANTMIVNRVETYGLSQLHQLRGRIGRSNQKAYAYFVIPKNRNLSDIANQRLEALQTYSQIGSGFAIASSDLELRGAGDILGPDQSGHIEGVGLELYMDLLKEAIAELKGEQIIIENVKNMEILLPFSSSIPISYINDPSQRLKYYKKLSNCSLIEELVSIKEEFIDIFGLIPEELQNLFLILEIRLQLQKTAIISFKASGKTLFLRFSPELIEKNSKLRDQILATFLNQNKKYKLTPDFGVHCYFEETPDQKRLLDFSKEIAQKIVLC